MPIYFLSVNILFTMKDQTDTHKSNTNLCQRHGKVPKNRTTVLLSDVKQVSLFWTPECIQRHSRENRGSECRPPSQTADFKLTPLLYTTVTVQKRGEQQPFPWKTRAVVKRIWYETYTQDAIQEANYAVPRCLLLSGCAWR